MLVWGATGGIGGYAVQYVLNGGGIPVGVVSSPEQGRRCSTTLGVRSGDRPRGRGLPVLVRRAHPGRGASGAASARTSARWSATTPTSCSSTPAARRWARRSSSRKRGGTVVTCAATSGYMVEFDNRHFWMKLKRLDRQPLRQLRRGVGGQPADRARVAIQPLLSAVYPLDRGRRGRARRSTATSTRARSACCASRRSEGLGIDDPEQRAQIGEDKITLFRTAAEPAGGRGPNDCEHSGDGSGRAHARRACC